MNEPAFAIYDLIIAGAPAHRPVMGDRPCPWCQTGLLFYCIDRQERLTLSCTTENCAQALNIQTGKRGQRQLNWMTHSLPAEHQ